MSSPRKFYSGALCAVAWLSACSSALDFASVSSGRTSDAAVADAAVRHDDAAVAEATGDSADSTLHGADSVTTFVGEDGIERTVESERDVDFADAIDAGSIDAGAVARPDACASDASTACDPPRADAS